MDERVRFFSEGVPVAALLGRLAHAGRSPAIVLCHGLTAVKEMWLERFTKPLEEAGFVTLRFDYRHFGESGGEPRGRVLPLAQVEDARNAVTYLQSLDFVDPERVAMLGVMAGSPVASYAAGVDPRIRCLVGLAGPADNERVFRRVSYEAVMAEAVPAKRRFVTTGEAPTMSWEIFWRELDPDVPNQVARMRAEFARWSPEITKESFVDFLSFKAESVVERISPRPALWIHAREDDRIPLAEAQSFFAKAREPKKLVVVAGGHGAYFGAAFDEILAHVVGWFGRHLQGEER